MSWFGRLRRELAVQDYVVVVFLLVLCVAASRAPNGPARDLCVRLGALMLTTTLLCLVLVRGGVVRGRFWASLVYRVGVFGAVPASYFYLGKLLPLLVRPGVDEALYQLDLRVFGFEPAVVMDAWVRSGITEWFAFFYYSYFFLVGSHLLPIVFGCRDQRRLGEFGLGLLLAYSVGHVGYMLVPGYGPYWYLAAELHHPLPSGFWTNLVLYTVAAGGSKLDIFPSLHTAAPTFIALYSFRHRRTAPYRYTWIPIAFFTANIIVATMFLRWHYLIDVVAGLVLATTVAAIACSVTAWERARRAGRGVRPVWPMFTVETTRTP